MELQYFKMQQAWDFEAHGLKKSLLRRTFQEHSSFENEAEFAFKRTNSIKTQRDLTTTTIIFARIKRIQ